MYHQFTLDDLVDSPEDIDSGFKNPVQHAADEAELEEFFQYIIDLEKDNKMKVKVAAPRDLFTDVGKIADKKDLFKLETSTHVVLNGSITFMLIESSDLDLSEFLVKMHSLIGTLTVTGSVTIMQDPDIDSIVRDSEEQSIDEQFYKLKKGEDFYGLQYLDMKTLVFNNIDFNNTDLTVLNDNAGLKLAEDAGLLFFCECRGLKTLRNAAAVIIIYKDCELPLNGKLEFNSKVQTVSLYNIPLDSFERISLSGDSASLSRLFMTYEEIFADSVKDIRHCIPNSLDHLPPASTYGVTVLNCEPGNKLMEIAYKPQINIVINATPTTKRFNSKNMKALRIISIGFDDNYNEACKYSMANTSKFLQ